ncbi:sugar ABC transporter permease, partial [Escherichia coli]|nr:sugar ABC transporter permease [Escherichia coli]
NYTLFAAGALLVAVPITLLFVFTQKHITTGLVSGAVKE